ncbi:GSCOCG00011538001-RA-CDS [Cotesia congregata]|uniref:Uncharacterized protein n=1 Tax=Cotesia congregata TaxID=51543 RepID=A0A8J2H343_COTCN|nr:GSCOCG00011538001-RA-CDS [Cotesia congregata]CAG5073540.1 Protein of unknown function [Cotesia congregata]
MYQSRCLTILFCWTICQSYSQPFDVKMNSNDTNKTRIFSPRMDYDEWTPLGRGDPLKNDPTFDYVPPVLDRVQYWLDTQTSTEASSKRDILILGVTAKKTSPKISEHYLKFADSPKLTRIQESQDGFRNDFTGSTGAEPPKLVRATKFRTNINVNGNSIDFRNQNRIQSLPASYYPSPYYNEKPKPYTMMMPPPINQKSQLNQFGSLNEEVTVAFRPGHLRIPQKAPLSTSLAFDKSNLIYQSTQTLDPWTGNSESSINTWLTNDKYDDHFDHHAAASSNHQVIMGQNTNIIVDDSQKNEQVVVGKKEVSIEESNMLENKTAPETHVVLPNTSTSDESVTVTVVMPMNYKSNVSEENEPTTTVFMTIPTLSTTITTMSTPIPIQSTRTPWRQSKLPPRVFPRRPGHPEMKHIPNNEMIHQMPLQKLPLTSMQAPTTVDPMRRQVLDNSDIKSPLAAILNQEDLMRMTMTTSTTSATPTAAFTASTRNPFEKSTTADPPTTILSNEQSSNSISFHSKQPIHKPMYLIIQGHSKVKTYKPTVIKHSLPPDNAIASRSKMMTTSRPISKFEQFVNDNTRVAPTMLPRNTENNQEVKAAKEKRVEHDSLLSLVESGLSALTAPPLTTLNSATIDQDNTDSTYDDDDDDDDLLINN